MTQTTGNGTLDPPARTGPDGPCGTVITAGLCLLAAAVLVTVAVATLIVQRAVTVEESDAVARLVGAYPAILIIGAATGVITCVAALVLAARDVGRRRFGEAASQTITALAIIAASHVVIRGACTAADVFDMPLATNRAVQLSVICLVLACILWALRCWRGQSEAAESGAAAAAERNLEEAFRHVSFASLAKSALTGCLAAWAAATAICLPVAWFALTRTADETGELAGALVLSAAGVGTLSILLSAALAAVGLVVILLAKFGLLAGRTAPAVGMTASIFAIGYTYWGVELSFAHELRAFGLQLIIASSLVVFGLMWGVALSHHLLGLCSRPDTPRDASDALRTAVVAALTVWMLTPLRWLGIHLQPSRTLLAVSCAVVAAALAGLIKGLFPEFEDFLDRIQFLLVILIVLFAVLAGRLLTPRRSRRWLPQAAILGLVILACVVPVTRSRGELRASRPQVFRYDPLGKYSLTLLERAIPHSEDGGGEAVAPDPAETTSGRHAVMAELRARRPLTILIIWDAARPDHMSLYGYARSTPPILPTTPNLDAHKDELLRFTRAYSQATATSCSLRHLFTGRYSSRWMLQTEGIAPFWTNDLLAAGYHTAHLNIIGSDYNGLSVKAFYRDMPPPLKQRLAVFDCFCCPPDNRKPVPDDEQTYDPALPQQLADPKVVAAMGDRPRIIECNRQDEDKAVDDLLAFLATQTDTNGRGVFAYIHMDATHTPWARFEEVEDFGSEQMNRYDQTIRYCDLMTGRLIDGLKAMGMWDQALLIVAADHGTGLDEHGRYGGFHPWHEQVHIPLVMRIPGIPGREIDSVVGLFDLGPTLMDIFAPDTLSRFESRSLWPIILGDAEGDQRVLFGLNSFADCYFLIDSGRWHYIRHRREQYEQLYDLQADPHQRRSVIERDVEATKRYRQYMNWFLDTQGADRDYGNPYHYRGPDVAG